MPGIPAPAVYAVAGLGGMGLAKFLIFDAIGAAMIAGLVAGLGYGVGQHAVDVALLIDEYALWITLALVAVVSVRAGAPRLPGGPGDEGRCSARLTVTGPCPDRPGTSSVRRGVRRPPVRGAPPTGRRRRR